jgi:hypothetical protein
MTGKSVVSPLSLKCLLQGDALIDREADLLSATRKLWQKSRKVPVNAVPQLDR